jgi:hypothetical protein
LFYNTLTYYFSDVPIVIPPGMLQVPYEHSDGTFTQPVNASATAARSTSSIQTPASAVTTKAVQSKRALENQDFEEDLNEAFFGSDFEASTAATSSQVMLKRRKLRPNPNPDPDDSSAAKAAPPALLSRASRAAPAPLPVASPTRASTRPVRTRNM